ncbi:polysaccharide biosynthesis protein [Bittarella massiliensis (ex Durand et al. 2017)]|uniref:polysaccharide biosynthesis protein n=1 Tax=Bittarella massiliensis (ex Durand et al. 2017) TaxID=1720313 RepID=UPI00073E3896|nr:nucleoside-diphosphate sugar epimerase/dehydratase [Bittarella massiliensis (ex Durand et al. 2017)]
MNSLYNALLKAKRYVLLPFDLVLWGSAYYFAYAILHSSFSLKGYEEEFLATFFLYLICGTAVFLLFRIYNKMWQYADIVEYLYIGTACVVGNAAFVISSLLLDLPVGIRACVLATILSTFFIFLFRFVYKMNKVIDAKYNFPTSRKKKRLLIVGGGEACAMILSELKRNPQNSFEPVCIVDDDTTKFKRTIQGVPIMGTTDDVVRLCDQYSVDAILFAIANISLKEKNRIINLCAATKKEVNIIPDLYKVMTGQEVPVGTIRQVEVEDLLGREPIVLDMKPVAKYVAGRRVMVTGGGGTIGSELCRQVAKFAPQQLVIVDIYENNAYEIQQELLRSYGKALNLSVEIASIRDRDKMDVLFSRYRPEIIFHAAAHKHVPLMEPVPEEAVKNNVFGTLNLAQLADKYGVKRFVQISTDKAVNPTSVMGTTKRICEMIMQSMDQISETEFVAVRFGNVLGSNGSVIPLFKEQIRKGGPVTVTHPDIIRYFMTIPEAVSLVLTAGSLAKGGEIFVLDMGQPVHIRDLAENLIRLSGFRPNEDIKIEYTGLRPGEKLYEELLMDEEGMKETPYEKIFIGRPIDICPDDLWRSLDEMRPLAYSNQPDKVIAELQKIVPTFTPTPNKHS